MDEENIVIEKKKRGRPKGSFKKEKITKPKQRKPIEEINTTDDETYSEKDDAETDDENVHVSFEEDFLSDMTNNNFTEEIEEEKIEIPKVTKSKREVEPEGETYTEQYCKSLLDNADKKRPAKDSFKGLYSNKPTEIIGKDKRVLLSKLNQYKLLFPDQLKTFKIKQNSSVEELQSALKEAEAIVETTNLETFLTDSILQSLKVIEGGSTLTKYDISGLSDALKKNVQFHSLVKQLYIKYSVFSRVPAEYSLIILVSTTAYTCFIINQRKKELNKFLDEPISLPQQ